MTAQRVRSAAGEREIHAFLHAHDIEGHPFPEGYGTWASRLPVDSSGEVDRVVRAGGNAVLSFIDFAVQDLLWRDRWFESEGMTLIAQHIRERALRCGAWARGPAHIAFSCGVAGGPGTPLAAGSRHGDTTFPDGMGETASVDRSPASVGF